VDAAFLVVDKPVGLTSHDVVGVMRAVLGLKRVGHTGTLDPFATGALPLALGTATRLIQYLDEDHKVYDATLQLGARTETGDLEGAVEAEAPVPPLAAPAVEAVLAGFLGERMQVPPRYSAVKVNGRRLYEYARAGQHVEVAARPVRIDALELLAVGADTLRLRVTCGRGTYVRALGEEIAQALGTEGHLVQLRRLASGPFGVETALDFATLSRFVADRDDWQPVLRPQRGAERVSWKPRSEVRAAIAPWLWSPRAALAGLPEQPVAPAVAARVRQGAAPPQPAGLAPGQRFLVVQEDALVAVAEAGPKAKLLKVLGADG
jgi:tRNA pseudouridine55 synthase